MVIHVNQIKTGVKIEYEITGADGTYTGKTPALSETKNIQLKGPKDNLWVLKYKRPPLFRRSSSIGISFGFKHRINEFRIKQEDQELGKISKLRYDKIKTRYDVSFGESSFLIYPLYQGGDEFLLVFQGDTQIAHIKRDTFTRNLKDHYIIYLPDEFSASTVPMLLFVLYYDHCQHGNRGEYRKGSVEKSYAFSYGEANLLYNPKWLKVNFPQEPNTPIKIDVEKSKTLGRRLASTQTILTILFFVAFLLFLIFIVGDLVTSIVITLLYIIMIKIKNRRSMK